MNTTDKRIEEIVRKAGAMLLEGSRHVKQENIHSKQGPGNYVTDYDTAIQKYLISEISLILPHSAFFGEEDTEGNTHAISGHVFYIDPIDGTTNFMFGYGHSCVSVGLGLDGAIEAGWVYDPFLDEFYYARKNEGSYLNGRRLQIEDKPLASGIAPFGCARYNSENAQSEIIEKLFMSSLAIRNGGSAAIDLCRIASGSNVAYFEVLLQPYDFAAASVIIEEAGGIIAPISLDSPCMVVAGTPTAVGELRKIVEKVTEC